jgi:hypothetical protein
MAKKKASKPTKTKAKKATNVTPNAMVIRGTSEWRAWVNRLADHCRTTGVNLVDVALAHYAKHAKFGEPAPKRMEEKTK